MSVLRGKCPYCKTYTAVAVGPGYECHSCGREFAAGLVRVPRAWGDGGDLMVRGASLELRYPEVAVIEESSLGEQELAMAASLPERPLVLGGCCCSHVGAIEALSARFDRLALVWLDAHGDLNTPETSPSGNQWGMPLRMVLDAGSVRIEDAVLVGARNLDPPEEAFIREVGLGAGVDALAGALDGADAVYVAFDVDVMDPDEVPSFMPEPGGWSVDEAEQVLRSVADRCTVAGAGLTGTTPDPEGIDALQRLVAALGL
jgi:arginase family enzyme